MITTHNPITLKKGGRYVGRLQPKGGIYQFEVIGGTPNGQAALVKIEGADFDPPIWALVAEMQIVDCLNESEVGP